MEETNDSVQYNPDEVNPPDFLNREYFENVLRKSENDKALTITEFKMVPGTKAGDHFASIMFKAIISYTSRGKTVNERSLVVKTVPIEEGFKKDMLQNSPIFEREISLYTEVLAEMKRIMESIGDHEELAPKLVYHDTNPPTLIFEDVSKLGYKMHPGFLDFDNAVIVLKKLAKFHALSYYINDNKYNHTFDLTKYGTLMSGNMLETMQLFMEGFNYLKDEVANWPGFEEVAKKLSTQNATFSEKLTNTYVPNPEPGLNVLCHGDFHIRNMMFIKNGDNVDKTMLLDFQMSFWGSPAIDLIYVLYAIGESETRKRRGEILSIYHETLTEYLNRLGCLKRPPTLLDLNVEMLKRGAIEILWSICFLPLFHLDYTKIDMTSMGDPTPENMAKFRAMMFNNEEILKMLKEVLPELLFKGILS